MTVIADGHSSYTIKPIILESDMDDELRAYLDAMRSEFNNAQERLLNRLASLEQDFQNTKGFLVGDAIVSGRRWLDLDERVNRLERDRKADG